MSCTSREGLTVSKPLDVLVEIVICIPCFRRPAHLRRAWNKDAPIFHSMTRRSGPRESMSAWSFVTNVRNQKPGSRGQSSEANHLADS